MEGIKLKSENGFISGNTSNYLTLGIMGGMGPAATVDFFSEIVARTPASSDQDHIPIIVLHSPGMPDRQSHDQQQQRIISRNLRIMAEKLEMAGADLIALPCNTAHVYIEQAREAVSIPFLHIVDETVSKLLPDAMNIAILGTTFCLESNLYQTRIARAAKQSLIPTRLEQDTLMRAIYKIKHGRDIEGARDSIIEITNQLTKRGADTVIAACTEIPLVVQQSDFVVPLLSSTAILAEASIRVAGLGHIMR
ncbi:MAG: aspartate racemase [Candidatus Azotimanducaceae bacterium]